MKITKIDIYQHDLPVKNGPFVMSSGPVHTVAIRDGHIELPKGPGLGLTVDAAQFGEPIASF